MTTEREGKGRGWQQNVATGTSNLGMVAGPAALYGAISGRKEGGIPRKLTERATTNPHTGHPTKFGNTKPGTKLRGIVTRLNDPTKPGVPKKYKIAAGVAGGTAVALQSANWLGDTIVARSMAGKKHELGKAETRFKTEEDLRNELARQRRVGRDTTLIQIGGAGAGIGGVALHRKQYSPADRAAIRDARVRAYWNNAGRHGVLPKLNRRGVAAGMLALGGPAVAVGAGRWRDQASDPWR